MRNFGLPSRKPSRLPVPRGIARSGPPLLSYGFRPFFLAAGSFAVLDMVLWIGALSRAWPVGGAAGPIAWHAHEMLFGYGAAALCGFVLTAVPNWTGRLPVSGTPLLVLFALWLAGRLAMLSPGWLGETWSATVDALFLPALAFIVAREVITGRNWQNLRIAAGITGLACLNLGFHFCTLAGVGFDLPVRAAVAVFVLLVTLVGGRIIPSFTRNYLVKRGVRRLPRPMGRADRLALALTALAMTSWALLPALPVTAILAIAAAAANLVRLARWRGAATLEEPLLLVLHLGYGFVPLGLLAVAGAAIGLLSEASALHVLTVGAIGTMTLAVMTRASRGHTGRELTASWPTSASYFCLMTAAVTRPLAEMLPQDYHLVLSVSAAAWIAAFGLFVLEHAPMLAGPVKGAARRPGPEHMARKESAAG